MQTFVNISSHILRSFPPYIVDKYGVWQNVKEQRLLLSNAPKSKDTVLYEANKLFTEKNRQQPYLFAEKHVVFKEKNISLHNTNQQHTQEP